jgi:hypothetical protein
METLKEIFTKHKGKVSDKWELYLNVYEQIFKEYRSKPIKLLEIGIQNGGSLEIWSKYFHKDTLIYGIDIDEKCKNLKFTTPNIRIIIGDVNSKTVLEKLTNLRKFDIIIDDGSHLSKDIIKSFLNLFPFLKEGGIYIIEDLHCSYWEHCGGGLLRDFTAIEFLKLLVDILNYEHWRLNKERKWLLKDFFKIYNTTIDNEELAKIHSITFYNSLAIIKKEKINKNLLGKRIVVGKEALVSKDMVDLHGSFIHSMKLPYTPKIYPTSIEMKKTIEKLIQEKEALGKQIIYLANTLSSLTQEKIELEKKLSQLEEELIKLKSKKDMKKNRGEENARS